MATLRVTPETLDKQGNDLIGFAGELNEIMGKVDKKINEIVDGWDGLAQDAYFEMYQTMKQSLEKFPELVDALGQATVSAAQAYSGVDEQLQGSFKSAM